METTTKLHSQIAQEAGVSKDAAQSAAYLLDLSRAGKTLDQAAALMRRDRAAVRAIARDWSIEFPDYVAATPLQLLWSKVAGGVLDLHLGGVLVGRAQRRPVSVRSEVQFEARWMKTPGGPSRQASSVLIAAKQLSVEIDRQCVELLGVDDIEIHLPDSAGGGSCFTPNRSAIRAGFAPPCRP